MAQCFGQSGADAVGYLATMSFYKYEQSAMDRLQDHFPWADDLRRTVDIAVSPFDTTTTESMANAVLVSEVVFRHPVTKDGTEQQARGPAYGQLAKLLWDVSRFPNLKKGTICADDYGSGPVRKTRHTPVQLLMSLSDRPLDVLTLARTTLPEKLTPYFLGHTKARTLIFREVNWLGDDDFVLSQHVKSLCFHHIVQHHFVSAILESVSGGCFLDVTVEHTAPKLSAEKWRAIKKGLPAVQALTIVHPVVDDESCSIFKDLLKSGVRHFHLVRPTFSLRMLEVFLNYVEYAELESIRLTGCVEVAPTNCTTQSPDAANRAATVKFLGAVAKSNIPFLGFVETSCTVGGLIANAIKNLRVEVLDVGLLPPTDGERNPGEKLLAALKKNKTLGAFKEEYRRVAAFRKGIFGLNVRALHTGVNPNVIPYGDHGRTWEAWGPQHMDAAMNLCRRNLVEYKRSVGDDDDSCSDDSLAAIESLNTMDAARKLCRRKLVNSKESDKEDDDSCTDNSVVMI